ncbi:MAG: secretin N-terminal domain-containing protein [Pseudomonadota bacterium]
MNMTVLLFSLIAPRRAWTALLCWGLLCAPALGEETRLEVIPLKHLSAEQAVALLKPLLDEQDALSGMNNQLVVRAAPARLEQIKQALAKFDVAPRRLLISVKQDAEATRAQNEQEISARVRGDKAQATLGRAPDESGVEVRIARRDQRADDARVQQLRVLEGSRAFIEIGQSVPVAESKFEVGGVVPHAYNSITYKDVTTGFAVLARLSGDDGVTLEITPQRNTVNERSGGRIDIQQAHTTVSGRLGEWIDIGGALQERSETGAGLVYSTRDLRDERRRILVKVDKDEP